MPDPPSGTVTFLFTDIEGSTKLWGQSPAAMEPALARHNVLLREAIEHNDGYVFKTMGVARLRRRFAQMQGSFIPEHILDA